MANSRNNSRLWDALAKTPLSWENFEIGISARAAGRAQRQARQKGIKAGLFRPITLWPFPEAAFQKAAKKAKHIIVPEMNAGQLIVEVDRLAKARTKGIGINRIDGEVISPAAILNKIEEVA